MNQPKAIPFFLLDRLSDQAIARYGLISDGDSILIGVSGGPDSVALLYLLLARAREHRLRLGVAHLDHLLRKESGGDADFVRGLSHAHGLPFYTQSVDVRAVQRRLRLSLEEAARRERFQFLRETARRHAYGKVALGHHADDNAETLLMNLLRGSGRLGLGGIPPVREGFFIRPMIQAARSDIMDYLRNRGLSYLTDRTNTENQFLRNRIRHELIPLLERDFQPRVRAILSRTASIFRVEEEWLESLVKPILEEAMLSRGPGQLALSAIALARMHPAAARRVVRGALRLIQDDLARITFTHLDQIMELVHRRTDAGPLHFPQNVRIRRQGDRLILTRLEGGLPSDPEQAELGDYQYHMAGCSVLSIRETGDTIILSEMAGGAAEDAMSSSPQTAFLDWDAIAFPITIRNFRPGDRFSPLGVDGMQKLKKFFIDHKVPREQRRRCPLLISRGRILWVAGHRLDHRARLTGATQRVLKAELLLAKPREMITVHD